MKNAKKYLEDFNAYMTLKNFSVATRKAYTSGLQQFFKYRDREGMTGPLPRYKSQAGVRKICNGARIRKKQRSIFCTYTNRPRYKSHAIITESECLERFVTGQGKKWQTINGDYSAMRKLFREVLDLPWDIKKLPRPRKERSLPKILSQKEVIQIIEAGTIFKHQVFIAFL